MKFLIYVIALSFAMLTSVQSVQAAQAPLRVSTIVAQQQQIRVGVEAGSGIYKEMPKNKREELLAKQDQLLQMLAGKQTTEELNEGQKIQAFNTLEWIEATVNNAEDERMVCERRTTIGSNRKERVCKTMAQIKMERDEARSEMDSRGVCRDCKSN